MPSENTAGADQTADTGKPGDSEEKTDLKHLGDLLAESEPGDKDKDAGASEDDASGSKDAKLTKFNDLTGKTGMGLDDLYKLEVSQAEDGTSVTVENLKDAHAKQAEHALREIEFEERRTTQESELMQAQEELRELMAAMPEKAIKPEVLQKVRDKHEAHATLERKRTLEVIPDWQDKDTRTADIEAMTDHLKQYGFPGNYLSNVVDHRQMKYIRDNMQREQRIRKALAAVKVGKPNPTTRQKPAGKAPSKKPLAGVKRGNSHNKLEAVFSDLD